MLKNIPLTDILFIDIETVATASDYYALNDRLKSLWKKKMRRFIEILPEAAQEQEAAEQFERRAAIFAEFGRIVCISCGVIREEDGRYFFRTKSFYGHQEAELLKGFADTLQRFFKNSSRYICGHNIKEFDIPFMCRRYLVQGLELPKPLQLYGKKPWELNFLLDTLHYWKFGDYKSYTSLDLLAYSLGVESPKDELDGSQVTRVYYQQNKLSDIVKYCEKDIFVTAKVFLKLALHQIEIIPEHAG